MDNMNDKERIEELRRLLHEHNRRYYIQNDPIISDQEFDALMNELQTLEQRHPELYDANSPTQHVGSDLNGNFEKVKHKYPMLSLSNTYNEHDVASWYDSVKRRLKGESFEICCEIKFDGLAISLIYIDGRLIRGVTRGDGSYGDDVTSNVRTIRSIPQVLQPGGDYPKEFEIRGEILMPWKEFERLNMECEKSEEKLYANPRNAAAGILKSFNSKLVASRNLDSYLYYLLGDDVPCDGHYENMQKAAEWGFKISDAMRKVDSLSEIFDYIRYWDVERKNLPVATDGIVLKVNSLRQQRELKNTEKSPRWAIAYKFKAERACTRLTDIKYQVGRTGQITPVACLDEVRISGTSVRRATLNNEDFMKKMDLHIGDYVYVEKGGEIIPKIVGVAYDKRDDSIKPATFITHCPECGSELVRYEGEAAYYCPNDSGCPPQIKGRIEHFIARKAMNIDSIGPETVDEYYRRRLISNFADLYDIKIEDINGDGNRERSARKVLNGINASKSVPFERVVFALGIRFVGETSAKLIARHFKNMDALMDATEEELKDVDGIGDVIARSVVDYFASEKNRMIVERLKKYGLQMSVVSSSEDNGSDKLAGMNIVISGVFANHTRDEYKAMIEKHGGKNVSSISSKTTFVLAGEKMGPSKLQKAESLGVKIVDEDTFLKMLM